MLFLKPDQKRFLRVYIHVCILKSLTKIVFLNYCDHDKKYNALV